MDYFYQQYFTSKSRWRFIKLFQACNYYFYPMLSFQLSNLTVKCSYSDDFKTFCKYHPAHLVVLWSSLTSLVFSVEIVICSSNYFKVFINIRFSETFCFAISFSLMLDRLKCRLQRDLDYPIPDKRSLKFY